MVLIRRPIQAAGAAGVPRPAAQDTTLQDAARASYAAIADLPPLTGWGKGKEAANTRAIAAGIVDVLLDDAARAVTNPASASAAADDAAAARIWDDLLDLLAQDGLSPVYFCTRTGRAMGRVSPDGWRDYLAGIAALGETRAADDAMQRLYDAMIVRKGHEIAPAVLTSSADNLAMIRATCPVDFLMIATGRLWPMPRGASSFDLARRGETLGKARAWACALPPATVQYACEIVTLFLSNIDLPRVPIAENLLMHYSDDIAAPWQSAASAAHFCGRLIQMITRLIARHRTRPLDQITRADLRALRIHWKGHADFQAQRQARAEYRLALQAAVDLNGMIGNAGDKANQRSAERFLAAGGVLPQIDDFAASLLDALDLQIALASTGRAVPLHAESQAEKVKARQVVASYRDATASGASDADPFGDLFDLSQLMAGDGMPSDLLPVIDSEEDLISAGLMTVSDLLGLDESDLFGADEDEDEDEDAPMSDADLARAISAALGEARASAPRPRPAARPKPSTADDLVTQALQAALDAPDPAPRPASSRPVIRIMRKQP